MREKNKKLWFKAKQYGWGWYPATWEGWMITFGFVVLFSLHAVLFIDASVSPSLKQAVGFILRTVLLVAFLIYVCYRHGEKPGWHWGEEPKEELYTVYTKEGKKTGEIATKTDVHAKGLWHATVHVWVVTPNKEVLLQKRSPHKSAGAGEWDNHGGHMGHAETPETAIIREVKEEIGIALKPESLKETIRYSKSRSYQEGSFIENEHIIVFIAEVPVTLSDVKVNPEEVSEVRFFSLAELSVGKAPDGAIIAMSAEEYQVLLAHFSSETTNHGTA